jgi:uncharacterized membrane protein
VVTVGGTSSITGPFLASLLLGIGDVAGKYYVPTLGAFVIYTIMIVVLIWRPQACSRAAWRDEPRPSARRHQDRLAGASRWHVLEIAFWLAALRPWSCCRAST